METHSISNHQSLCQDFANSNSPGLRSSPYRQSFGRWNELPVLPIEKPKPPSLVGLCLGVVGKHFEDIIEDLGDIASNFPADIKVKLFRPPDIEFKLCKVRSVQFGQKGIPYINTYDGRTIRYLDPLIKANDTIKLDLEAQKITDFMSREKHKGSFETIHVQDATGHEFATRMGNIFTIGKGSKPWVSLPKGKGIKLSIIEEAKKRHAAQVGAAA
ncbi:hypothetical protein RHGRI_013072 [Rhododendron griersonianum]|uniref:Ribosomal protein S4 n=1 Tax=Rhododendron griersonianum TaxID=479676 RepID=A0AAV6K4B7_9ERIC|nr:hypothetical protein RHGRI_013072 [Rhododendron griersonianum]